jgi:hypothetical protein
MEQIKGILSAEVAYSEGRSLRVKTVTTIRIVLGGKLLVAERVAGGKYSQRQALADFARNPGLYQTYPAYETAKAMKLAA